ncbi:WG repeat-containing protein [Pleomorphovibrio marinus]|uniref:WG repeat-containing protein n=1 Tax=Pleomorphovibrio marinus TaxID=2164132 RepID=UPI000E0B89C7|nr:WG repeat-containing protein [Pleomorphovibrio marinus]
MTNSSTGKFIIGSLFCAALVASEGKGQTWEIFDEDYKLVKRVENGDFMILGSALRVNNHDSGLSLLSSEYESFSTISDTEIYQYLEPWVIVKKGDKFGALHEYGDEVFTPSYDKIYSYFNLLLGKKGETYHVYDRGTKKTQKIGPYASARFALNGQIIAKTPQGYFLPLSDQPDHLYEELWDVNEDVLLSKEAGGYGLINRDGTYLLDPIIDEITYLSENHFYAREGNQYMLLKAHTNYADIKYSSYHKITYEDGVLLEYIHGKLRRIMKNDGILLDIVGMTAVQNVDDHFNVFFRDEKIGLLNPKGKWEVSPVPGIEKLLPGNQGLYGALIEGKYGFVNRNGEVMISPSFEEVEPFSEGLAAVKINGTWGYINTAGEVTVPTDFERVSAFHRGLAIVKKEGKNTIIDQTGSTLLAGYYDRILQTSDNYFITENKGKFGLVNAMGREVIEPQFQEIRREEHDKILIRSNDKYGVISENGDYQLPLYYSKILFDPSNGKVLARSEQQIVEEVEEDNGKKKRKKGA